MNNIIYMKKHKRMTQSEAHDYVSAKHRKEDFDPKSWKKATLLFWAGILAFGLLMAGLKYATACELEEAEEVEIRTVPTF